MLFYILSSTFKEIYCPCLACPLKNVSNQCIKLCTLFYKEKVFDIEAENAQIFEHNAKHTLSLKVFTRPKNEVGFVGKRFENVIRSSLKLSLSAKKKRSWPVLNENLKNSSLYKNRFV